MISLNTQQKLSGVVFWSLMVGSIIAGAVFIVLGIFLSLLGTIHGTSVSNGVTTAVNFPAYIPGLILIALGIIGPLYKLLWLSTYSFVLAERMVTINSGVIFKQSKTIDYNRIENVNNTRGPVQMLFGVTTVNIWTASPDQFSTTTTMQNGRSSTTTRATPEGQLHLAQQDAEEVRVRMTNKEAVQDVNIVSSQIVPPQA